jgi:ATP-dependent RNA helicase SUPV3L1/SUV3
VRFGAYHIYVPALLKPGASTLLAQLWALRHAETDLPGLAELPAISASGRTSVDVNPEFSANVYRRFGYRVYGARAVRIDILERLADLIRPALSWSPARGGERPEGAIDTGRGFIVTPAMTSLLGASGEDMAVILRGLGYHAESRPASELTIAPKAEPESESEAGADTPSALAAGDVAAATDTAAAVTTQGAQQGETAAEAPAAAPADAPIEAPAEAEASEAPVAPEPDVTIADTGAAGEGTATVPPAGAQSPETPSSKAPSAQTPSSAAPEPVPAGDEPAMVEVWRIGGQRRHAGRSGRRSQRTDGRSGETKSPPPRGKEQSGAGPAANKAGGQRKGGKPGKYRPAAKPRHEKPIDPDNPFAALAALKKNLEKTGDR